MDIKEIRAKKESELKDLLSTLKKEQFNLRFQQVSGELEKTSRIREVRKTVAKIKTVLTEQASGDKK